MKKLLTEKPSRCPTEVYLASWGTEKDKGRMSSLHVVMIGRVVARPQWDVRTMPEIKQCRRLLAIVCFSASTRSSFTIPFLTRSTDGCGPSVKQLLYWVLPNSVVL